MPVYIHRKEESWVKLRREPEHNPEEQEEEDEVRSGTGSIKCHLIAEAFTNFVLHKL